MPIVTDPTPSYGDEIAALAAQIAAATAAGLTAKAAILQSELDGRVAALITDPTDAYSSTKDRVLARRWSTGAVYELSVADLRRGLSAVFNVTDYGAIGNGVTDDTAAIQAAIDAASAAGGGVVYLRAGIYLCNGAFTARSNSILQMPDVASAAAPKAIILQGDFPPLFANAIATSGQVVPTAGTIIKSTRAGTGTRPAILGGIATGGSFTNVLLGVRNMTIRTFDNPTLSAINAGMCAEFLCENVVIDTGTGLPLVSNPTTAAAVGVRMPENNNGAYSYMRNVNVAGYYVGVEVGEHADISEISSWFCRYGYLFYNAHHAMRCGRIMSVWCVNPIGSGGNGAASAGSAVIQIQQLNIEANPAVGPWYTADVDIADGSQLLVGTVHIHRVKPGLGAQYDYTRSGGAGLKVVISGLPTDGILSIAGHIDAPTAKAYSLECYAPTAGVLAYVRAKLSAGTCSIKLQIDGVDVTGSTLAVTTTLGVATFSALFTYTIGQRIDLVVSAPTGAANLSYTVKNTRL